jgi:hypothetical protein
MMPERDPAHKHSSKLKPGNAGADDLAGLLGYDGADKGADGFQNAPGWFGDMGTMSSSLRVSGRRRVSCAGTPSEWNRPSG